MKKAIVGLWIFALSTSTWAACSTHTVTQNGRMVTCTTCCFGPNCNTTCF